mgnify:CR=1 FL=1
MENKNLLIILLLTINSLFAQDYSHELRQLGFKFSYGEDWEISSNKISNKENPNVYITWKLIDSSKLEAKKLIKEATENIELIEVRCTKILHRDLVRKENKNYSLGSDVCHEIYYNYLVTGKNKDINFHLILEKKNFKWKKEIETILNSISLLD